VPFATETVVWLIRHGASTFNLEGRCQGCCDEPALTEEGRDAARLSGYRLGRSGIWAVISSPLRRAAETAREIVAVVRHGGGKVGLETDARLREIELPQWEGLPVGEIPRRFHDQFLTWRSHPALLAMESPSGEAEFPVRKLYSAVRDLWRDLLSTHAGKSILLVTHSGTARALITTALGMDEDCFHSFQQSNCGISRLRFASSGTEAYLELLNDTSHLDDRLPKLKEGRTGVQLLLIPAGIPHLEDLRRLSRILSPITVETVLVGGFAVRNSASLIFPGRSQKRVEQVSKNSLATRLRQILETCDSNALRHIAVVAPPDSLQLVLRERFALPGSGRRSLVLTTPWISAVHCPGRGVPPVLQAVNAFEKKSELVGVSVCEC
jgi:probable phosphoglycerate mutase